MEHPSRFVSEINIKIAYYAEKGKLLVKAYLVDKIFSATI